MECITGKVSGDRGRSPLPMKKIGYRCGKPSCTSFKYNSLPFDISTLHNFLLETYSAVCNHHHVILHDVVKKLIRTKFQLNLTMMRQYRKGIKIPGGNENGLLRIYAARVIPLTPSGLTAWSPSWMGAVPQVCPRASG